MAPPKKNSTAVATFGDHEVITPENKLRKVVNVKPQRPGEDDPVARAEKALADLSTEFSSWMDTECERLDQARRNIAAGGFTAANKDAVFRAAHDIKGEAATFGFPLVALAADSLCRLIEHTPDVTRIPVKLVDQHVDAVRAIHREYSRSDAKESGRHVDQAVARGDRRVSHSRESRPAGRARTDHGPVDRAGMSGKRSQSVPRAVMAGLVPAISN